MDWTALLNLLPGGPKAIQYYALYVMPPVGDYDALEKAATLGRFPTIGAIVYPALFYAALFGVMRMVLTYYIFRVCKRCVQRCARYC
jgi:hypothetical protein